MKATGEQISENYRCGYVTILGRPNVGKSTLLNRLLGQKISITSRKPQTTRHHISGIKTGRNSQIIYIDTPGLQTRYHDAMNRYMRKEVMNSLADIDVLLFVIESLSWTTVDDYILDQISGIDSPVILVINKIDKVKDRTLLLPFIKETSIKGKYISIVPVSGKTGENLDQLEAAVVNLLPNALPEFPVDEISDKDKRFFAAEFIREKLTQKLGEELPYQISVTIEKFIEEKSLIKIYATVWVTNRSQKMIVIGKEGEILKSVGEQARYDMEKLFDKKVYVQTWVKVKKKWTNDASALVQFGYKE